MKQINAETLNVYQRDFKKYLDDYYPTAKWFYNLNNAETGDWDLVSRYKIITHCIDAETVSKYVIYVGANTFANAKKGLAKEMKNSIKKIKREITEMNKLKLLTKEKK